MSHAHIDHSGRIPLLVKQGFQGSICTTRLTAQLMNIMLRDSAHIQESDAEWQNRKGKRAGKALVEPLYTLADAEQALQQLAATARIMKWSVALPWKLSCGICGGDWDEVQQIIERTMDGVDCVIYRREGDL